MENVGEKKVKENSELEKWCRIGKLGDFPTLYYNHNKIINMRKTRKYLRFEQLKIELANQHPKQISRAILSFRDQDANTYKTSEYGDVTETTIAWPENYVQVLYANQEVFNFQTLCEHEYDYEKEQLKALYNGQIYIKTQYFFRPLTVHVFNSEGQKCGILRYMIKVVEKDAQATAKSKADSSANRNEPQVQVNLMAKITFYAATVNILTPNFKKDKYANDFSLQVFICGKKIDASYKKDFSWTFPSTKVEYMENSPKEVLFSFRHEEHQILKGSTNIQILAQNKRFITQSIPLYDSSNQKLAIMKIDLRYISKQELLDLLYSPTKLSNSKAVSKPDFDKLDKQEKVLAGSKASHYKKSPPHQTTAVKSNSLSAMHQKKHKELKSILSNEMPDNERTGNRYRKLYMMNNHHQMIIPRAKRFTEKIEVNPYVSYCDPDKESDFSPSKRHIKYNMSLSQKVDFTKPYKHNPGPGQYHLPSIWEKY